MMRRAGSRTQRLPAALVAAFLGASGLALAPARSGDPPGEGPSSLPSEGPASPLRRAHPSSDAPPPGAPLGDSPASAAPAPSGASPGAPLGDPPGRADPSASEARPDAPPPRSPLGSRVTAPLGFPSSARSPVSRRSEAARAVSPAGRWSPLRARSAARRDARGSAGDPRGARGAEGDASAAGGAAGDLGAVRWAGESPTELYYLPEPREPAHDVAVIVYEGSTAGLYVFPEDENPDFRFADLSPPVLPPSIARLGEDFERYPEGATPIDAGFRTEGLGDSVRVEVEGGAGGDNRYLEIADSPRLRSQELPALWYAPNHRAGTTSFSFDLRVDAATALRHEWRERRRSPTRIGPSFEIASGTLLILGVEVANLPRDEWVHFELAAPLGPGEGASWDLRVELGDGSGIEVPRLPFEDADFSSVGWLGFWSLGGDRSVWCLDNVSLGSLLETDSFDR